MAPSQGEHCLAGMGTLHRGAHLRQGCITAEAFRQASPKR